MRTFSLNKGIQNSSFLKPKKRGEKREIAGHFK
jgi:hypothetical protein